MQWAKKVQFGEVLVCVAILGLGIGAGLVMGTTATASTVVETRLADIEVKLFEIARSQAVLTKEMRGLSASVARIEQKLN